jgi:predicted nuclease of restriction endonuclease-like (RecB) superfamily
MFRKFISASGKLSWSHHVELLAVPDKDTSSFDEQESINSRRSVKELNRQIGTSFFEWLQRSNSEGKMVYKCDICRNIFPSLH